MESDIDVLSVGQVWRRSKNALAREFRHSVWVAGEIKSIREWRGNWYITLVEPGDANDGSDVSLDVACSPKRRLVIQSQLGQAGINLANGMTVRVQGPVTLGRLGKLQLELLSLDTQALVGAAELERRRLMKALEKEGLLRRNKSIDLSPVPLRVGLVGSEGSDGVKDFLTRLHNSRYAFDVYMCHAPVQGPAAAAAISAAVATFEVAEVDVVVVVRGGGGELDAFDKEPVVRAIASCQTPVWVGIGHTADTCLSDVVANASFATPTACAEALIERVHVYLERVVNAMSYVHRRVNSEQIHVEQNLRNAVSVLDRINTRWHVQQRKRLDDTTVVLAGVAAKLVVQSQRMLLEKATQVQTCVQRQMKDAELRNEYLRRNVRLLDPVKQVERGYAIVRDSKGRIVNRVGAVAVGEPAFVQMSDGRLAVEVTDIEQGSN